MAWSVLILLWSDDHITNVHQEQRASRSICTADDGRRDCAQEFRKHFNFKYELCSAGLWLLYMKLSMRPLKNKNLYIYSTTRKAAQVIPSHDIILKDHDAVTCNYLVQ